MYALRTMTSGTHTGTQNSDFSPKRGKQRITLSLTNDLVKLIRNEIKNEGGFDSLSPTCERLLRNALNQRQGTR